MNYIDDLPEGNLPIILKMIYYHQQKYPFPAANFNEKLIRSIFL